MRLRAARHLRRALDENDERIPDYLDPTATTAVSTTVPPLDAFYRWSVEAVRNE